jgi:ABC-type polysaccharide/polyol phosphate transport system ATPase subunit
MPTAERFDAADQTALPIGALTVDRLSKHFEIPQERVSTIKERVLHPSRARTRRLDVLDEIDFTVSPGEFFGIVGRNGSGKSTLLKCLAGVLQPNDGQIAFNGQMATFIELGVGFNPDLSARDNVVLNATLLGLSPAQARERFDEIIDFSGLHEFTELKLGNFSSGMLVRLAFSVAINVDADILLIDEVLAVGDMDFQQKCFAAFEQIKADGKTVIFVSHAMEMVERFCDRAMLIENGKIAVIGDPSGVALRYSQVNIERMTPLSDAASDRQSHMGDGADDDGERIEEADQGAFVQVKFRCRFNAAMSEPVFGVVIHDDAHRSIFATNTRMDAVKTGEHGPGSTATYTVRFLNEIERGLFFATPAVAHGSTLAPADSVDRAAKILVKSPREPHGMVNLPHQTEIAK